MFSRFEFVCVLICFFCFLQGSSISAETDGNGWFYPRVQLQTAGFLQEIKFSPWDEEHEEQVCVLKYSCETCMLFISKPFQVLL